MKKILVAIISLALLAPSLATAAQLRAYVAEFTVTPVETTSLKKSLQILLSSRMASDSIQPVSTPAEADVVITGSFTQLGKLFSLDAVATQPAGGRTLASAFEQGESQDELIPALGRLSAKLKAGIQQSQSQAPAAAAPAAAAAAAAAPAAGSGGSTVWLSQRINGAQLGIAPARTGSQEREFFVAEGHALRLYRQEKTLKLLAEVKLPLNLKVIAVDSAAPDQTGRLRAYVTIIDGETPSSRIYSYQDAQLKLVAEKVPFMFRALAVNGPQRIYAQEMGINEDFYGPLHPVAEDGVSVDKNVSVKLPRFANIYNYTPIPGPEGKNAALVFSPDGYLIVYTDGGEELWRSAERFGGSETFFQRQADNTVRETYERMRWRFLDQRVAVTPDGQIIVPQNSGFFVIGNIRSYSKYALFSFTWTGASLEERWRTKQSQNYLADFYYEPAQRDLVLLEVVQKDGAFTNGGATVRVIKAE